MKRFLSLVLAIAMMLTIAVPAFASTFTDIEDSDYKVAIERLYALGIVNGKTETEYDPDGIVTRAEMAKLLVVSLGLQQGATILENTVKFADTEGHWAIGYINVAEQYGLIKGDGDGNFRPDDTVNYAEAATMCIRALNYARVVDKQGEWPTNYLNKALELKLFDDVKFTNADDGANRGSVAQIIWNMIKSPMWVVTQESESDGIYYGKTGETMLQLKFPDYEVKECTFDNYKVVAEDDEYVVSVILDDVSYVTKDDKIEKENNKTFEYTKNDFYKFVPGTEVEALIYKDEECVSMYATDDNYLVEGTAKELADKYTKVDSLTAGSYAYLKLSSSKKDATIETYENKDDKDEKTNVDCKVELLYDAIKVVTKVETKKDQTTVYIYDEQTFKSFSNDNAIEEGYLVIKDGERADITDIKKGDVITVLRESDKDVMGVILANGSTVDGSFNGIIRETTREEEKEIITITIGSKDYVVEKMPEFYEIEINNDEEEEETVAVTDLEVEEKENEYLDKDVVAYFDEYDRLVKVVFGEVEEIEKSESFYLAVDGAVRTEEDRNGTAKFITLENKDGVEAYKIEKDYEDKISVIAGQIYWVEFNDDGEIEKITAIAELVKTIENEEIKSIKLSEKNKVDFGGKENSDYEATYEAGKVDEDYGYIIEEKETLNDATVKVTASTTVFSIVQLENDEGGLIDEYTLEIGKGIEATEGLENFVVVTEDTMPQKAKYVIAVGSSKSTEKFVGILEARTTRLDKAYVTISGTKFELADESIKAEVGSVVGYTENDGKAKLVYEYKVAQLAEAGEVTKVEDEFIQINESTKLIDMKIEKEEFFKENDFRVFVIEVEYDKDFNPYFDAVEEIEIDEIVIKKGDFLAIDGVDKEELANGKLVINTGSNDKYLTVIKNYVK